MTTVVLIVYFWKSNHIRTYYNRGPLFSNIILNKIFLCNCRIILRMILLSILFFCVSYISQIFIDNTFNNFYFMFWFGGVGRYWVRNTLQSGLKVSCAYFWKLYILKLSGKIDDKAFDFNIISTDEWNLRL